MRTLVFLLVNCLFALTAYSSEDELNIICSTAGTESCPLNDFECRSLPCGSAEDCASVYSHLSYPEREYDYHTPALEGTQGFNILTFTGSTVCSIKQACSTCGIVIGYAHTYGCRPASGTAWENDLVKARFSLSNACDGHE